MQFSTIKDIFLSVLKSQDSRQEAAVRALICNCRRFPPSNRIKCKSGGLGGTLGKVESGGGGWRPFSGFSTELVAHLGALTRIYFLRFWFFFSFLFFQKGAVAWAGHLFSPPILFVVRFIKQKI